MTHPPAQCVSGLKNHGARRRPTLYIRDGATRINGRECSSRMAWPDVFRSQGRADISGVAQRLALFLQKSFANLGLGTRDSGGQKLGIDGLNRKRRGSANCWRYGALRPITRETRNMTTKIISRTLAIQAASPAMPPKPNTLATMARTRKMSA